MENITLRKTFTVGGVPTNVTSFLVTVVRNDTQQVIVPETAMTNVNTGIYSLSFMPPAWGLQYTASYVVTFNGQEIIWADTFNGNAEEIIPFPPLTGHVLWDTLQSLLFQRIQLIRKGPQIDFSVHGHTFYLTRFMEHLDKSILHLRLELAQAEPYEIVTGCGNDWGGYGVW